MKKDLNELAAKYPKLFDALRWGFACNEGWYDILDRLFGFIQVYVDEFEKPQPKVTQVKEKFGGLRVYLTNTDDTINRMIDIAEQQAEQTCEYCGKPGHARNDMTWIKTLCDECTKGKE